MSKKKSATKSTMTLKDFHGGSIPSDLPLPSAPGVAAARPPDRPNPWTAPAARPRPGSAGAASRALDPPFLPHIGRHFDEDERKPFDSPSSPRRLDPVRPLPPKQRPVSSPAPPTHVPVPVFHPSGSTPNAWAARTPVVDSAPPPATVWSGPAAASRLAHASAIEKVSSGRWHSKPPAEVEVIKFHDPEALIEIGDGARDHGSFYTDAARPASSEGVYGGAAEVFDRPKLNLLPKKTLQDPPETRGYQIPVEPVRVEKVYEIHGGGNAQKPGSVGGSDAGVRGVERPKLNLKPRSLPVEQSAEAAERERKSVFGGARPRELVLKERGIDNFAANNSEVPSPTNRARSDTPKNELKVDSVSPGFRHGGRADCYSPEPRIGIEKKEYRPNSEKMDAHKSSWRNDNHSRNSDTEKHPESRRPEPDTWRKPVEEPKPDDAPGPRYGKAASALELAQAFSRPATDSRISSQSLPGRTQVPFSRLTAQRQINGY